VSSFFSSSPFFSQVCTALYWRKHEHGAVVWSSSRHRLPRFPPMDRTCSRALSVFACLDLHCKQYWLGPLLGSLLATVFYLGLEEYVLPPLFLPLTIDRSELRIGKLLLLGAQSRTGNERPQEIVPRSCAHDERRRRATRWDWRWRRDCGSGSCYRRGQRCRRGTEFGRYETLSQ
jgi:hypothetical protein